MNSENTSGKNFMPSVPAVLRNVVGDELVGYFGDRLQPSRHQGARDWWRRASAAGSGASPISMNSAEFVKAISIPPI